MELRIYLWGRSVRNFVCRVLLFGWLPAHLLPEPASAPLPYSGSTDPARLKSECDEMSMLSYGVTSGSIGIALSLLSQNSLINRGGAAGRSSLSKACLVSDTLTVAVTEDGARIRVESPWLLAQPHYWHLTCMSPCPLNH